jgi:hypothetical protein
MDVSSPGRGLGSQKEVEKVHHRLGIAFIVEASQALALSQDAVLSAQNLYHRFFFRQVPHFFKFICKSYEYGFRSGLILTDCVIFDTPECHFTSMTILALPWLVSCLVPNWKINLKSCAM